MVRSRLAGFGAAACLLLVSCGDGERPTAPSAEDSAPAERSAIPDPTAASAGPETVAQAEACAPPAGSLRGDASGGAAVYQQYCDLCHGPDAQPMQPEPVDHTDCDYMGGLSDEHLYRVICGGGTAVGKNAAMPPWGGGVLPTEDILALIAHLRSLCPA